MVRHLLLPFSILSKIYHGPICATLDAVSHHRQRDWPQVLGQRSQRGHRQEEQRADDHDRAKQQTSKGEGVVAQSAQAERSVLLQPSDAAIAIGAMIGR